MIEWIACILGAYLVGAIPFGVLIARTRGVDIRQKGSKNIGATNVGRVLGRKFGAICFLLDVLKGAIPVIVAGFVCDVINKQAAELTLTEMWLWLAVAVASIAGHMASIYLRFAGGKGVATSFGAMLAMWPLLTWPAIGALVVWYITLRLSRYVSLASMLGAVSLPFWYLVCSIPPTGENIIPSVLHASPPLFVLIALALLVIWRHRTNIARIRRGEEPKLGEP